MYYEKTSFLGLGSSVLYVYGHVDRLQKKITLRSKEAVGQTITASFTI